MSDLLHAIAEEAGGFVGTLPDALLDVAAGVTALLALAAVVVVLHLIAEAREATARRARRSHPAPRIPTRTAVPRPSRPERNPR